MACFRSGTDPEEAVRDRIEPYRGIDSGPLNLISPPFAESLFCAVGAAPVKVSTETENRIAKGGYAKNQILCKDRVIAWSHNSRFQMARRLVEPYASHSILDYGCG